MSDRKEIVRRVGVIFLFALIGGLAYLPNLSHFGYYNDDWYLMYAANAGGPGVFTGIYSIDRPARAVLMAAAYSFFGLNPLYYNISAFIFRILGAFAFLWILRVLWPRQSRATIVMALLFLIYPGFLSTPNAIDYQAQQFSLFLALFSIAVSIQAVVETRIVLKIFLWLIATLTAIAYLGLVEYFLGLEVLRLGAITILELRKLNGNFWRQIPQVIYRYVPFLVGPMAFIFWRFFIFESERKATNIGAQFSQLTESPLLILIRWGVTLLKDSFEVIFLSWGVPLTIVWDATLRLREMFLAGVLVTSAVAITIWILKLEPQNEQEGGASKWYVEAILLGIFIVVAGMIPVVLSNRDANFYYFSRYMLASSAGAVMILASVIFQLRGRLLRYLAVSLLVISSVMTIYLNGVLASQNIEAMRNFWWQVSWRIPQLRPGTTLVANYSHASIEEDYFVWGPANLIYYPESANSENLEPVIGAAVLNRDTLVSIWNHEGPRRTVRRSIDTYEYYSNILILTQPFVGACVQVVDGKLPILSESEQYDVMLAAESSKIDNVLTNDSNHTPPELIFGQEPEHAWCYYYEKASLAYQQKDWQEVIDLGKEAHRKGFSVADPVEWMPFLQAAAIKGDQQEVLMLAPKVKHDPFLTSQACQVLSGTPGIDAEMKVFVSLTFCETGQ